MVGEFGESLERPADRGELELLAQADLVSLGPDIIKLDRSLIEGIATDRAQEALAAGLISFAEKSGATIVAEGIEIDEELDALRSLGVAYGQGFLLARPGPLPLPRV